MSKLLIKLKTIVQRYYPILLSNRTIYAGLTVCHGVAASVTEKPEIYVPMAMLYALKTLKR